MAKDLKVGERVRIYLSGTPSEAPYYLDGTVLYTASNSIITVRTVHEVHRCYPQQLVRLKPRKVREWWIDLSAHNYGVGPIISSVFQKPEAETMDGPKHEWVRVREVRTKR